MSDQGECEGMEHVRTTNARVPTTEDITIQFASILRKASDALREKDKSMDVLSDVLSLEFISERTMLQLSVEYADRNLIHHVRHS